LSVRRPRLGYWVRFVFGLSPFAFALSLRAARGLASSVRLLCLLPGSKAGSPCLRSALGPFPVRPSPIASFRKCKASTKGAAAMVAGQARRPGSERCDDDVLRHRLSVVF